VFVHDYGWSWERWHTWAVETLDTLVLRPGGASARL